MTKRKAAAANTKYTFADWERKYLPRTAADESDPDEAAEIRRTLLQEAEHLLAKHKKPTAKA